jgi:hypothetical protein
MQMKNAQVMVTLIFFFWQDNDIHSDMSGENGWVATPAENALVEIALDEYNRREEEIKALEEETLLLEVEIDRLPMELKGIKKH